MEKVELARECCELVKVNWSFHWGKTAEVQLVLALLHAPLAPISRVLK